MFYLKNILNNLFSYISSLNVSKRFVSDFLDVLKLEPENKQAASELKKLNDSVNIVLTTSSHL